MVMDGGGGAAPRPGRQQGYTSGVATVSANGPTTGQRPASAAEALQAGAGGMPVGSQNAYNPTTMVYMGPSAETVSRQPPRSDTDMPTPGQAAAIGRETAMSNDAAIASASLPLNEAVMQFYTWDKQTLARFAKLGEGYVGSSIAASPERMFALWSDVVQRASMLSTYLGKPVSPWDVLKNYRNNPGWGGSGGGGGYGGGGGGYAGPVSRITLTNPYDAKTLANSALSAHLGRQATSKEITAFTKALNKAEMQNPVTVTPQGQAMSVQTGGISPQQFAEDYGARQEGAGEYAAATVFLDTFMQAIKNPMGGV